MHFSSADFIYYWWKNFINMRIVASVSFWIKYSILSSALWWNFSIITFEYLIPKDSFGERGGGFPEPFLIMVMLPAGLDFKSGLFPSSKRTETSSMISRGYIFYFDDIAAYRDGDGFDNAPKFNHRYLLHIPWYLDELRWYLLPICLSVDDHARKLPCWLEESWRMKMIWGKLSLSEVKHSESSWVFAP